MGRLWDFLRGETVVSLPAAEGTAVLRLLMAKNIPFRDLHEVGERVVFSLPSPYDRAYARLCAIAPGECRERRGLAAFLFRYRRRAGLAVGAALSLLLFFFASFFVWDVTFVGAETISEEALSEALARHGVYLGAFIPSIDREAVEQAMILDVDGLSWISLNLRGTVAAVEVRERDKNEHRAAASAPSNLVASCDGQIDALEVTGGVAAVRVGQVVKKGTLLVSGVIDSNALGYRLVRARGEVLARVTRSFDVEIPLVQTEKVYTGGVFTQKRVIFFAKSIKLFGKDSISGESCDTIEKKRRLYLAGKIKLPLTLCETVCYPYELREKRIDIAEARREAIRTISQNAAETLADATVLGRHFTFTETETGVSLHLDVDCILNIATEVKIETD